MYASCALKYGEKTTFESEGAVGCAKYSKMLPEGFGFNYFVNDSTEASIREVVAYTRFQGLELISLSFRKLSVKALYCLHCKRGRIIAGLGSHPSSKALEFLRNNLILGVL